MADTFLAWSTDPELRRVASSGGFTRAVLIHLLETNAVDRVLCARTGPKGGGFQPGYVATDDPDELRDRRTCSVYYPVLPFGQLIDVDTTYAATALPCFVDALRRHPSVTCLIELLCRFTPDPQWTHNLCRRLEVENPSSVAYRGDGWPGYVTIDGKSIPMPKSKMTPDLAMTQCKGCLRTCGDSDIVVADPWGMKGDMGDGKTLVHVRTTKGEAVVKRALEAEAIEVEPVASEVWHERMKRHRA